MYLWTEKLDLDTISSFWKFGQGESPFIFRSVDVYLPITVIQKGVFQTIEVKRPRP